jgi:hypothetical protein
MTWNSKDLPKPEAAQPAPSGSTPAPPSSSQATPTVALAAQLMALDEPGTRRLPPDVQREFLELGLIDELTWRQHRRLMMRGIIEE